MESQPDYGDRKILALWREGFDTYDISLRLGVHESEVANRLLHLRNQNGDKK